VRLPSRRKLQRARLLPVYLVALALLLVADPSPWSLALGAALVSGGLALRAWGAGHLVKTDRLIVTGPYAHLRHPLYAGALLVAAGLAAAAGPPGLVLLGLVVIPLFFLYYLPYKERIESARLEGRYGEAYAAYRRAVPALWPAATAWRPGAAEQGAGADARWSRARYLANHEHGTLAASLAGLALIAARAALRC
jgi:protein-S-isoprenylcysteine O-methyltransferase Ste14